MAETSDTKSTVIKNAEVWWLHMDPESPDEYQDDIFWSITIRTRDKLVKKEWEAQLLNVAMKEDDDGVFYQCTFRRNTVNAKGKSAVCPPVVNGKLRNIDSNTVGNGSIANINLFQRPNRQTPGKWVSTLMGVQVVVHKVYIPSENSGPMFTECQTETIQPAPDEDVQDFAADVNAGDY